MLLHVEPQLRESGIQVLLEGFKAQGVTVLMLAVIVSILLEAVVGQVDVVVLVTEGVVVRGSTEVAPPVEE